MLNPSAKLRALRRRSFLRDTSGAMAVEFAMVVLPLIFMLLSIMELALVFMVSATLENATNEISRSIRTGALQSGGTTTQATFRNAVCARLGWLQDQCTASLKVDVRVFSSFAGQTNTSPVTNGAFDDTKTVFNMGSAGDIILVRCFYHWRLVSPFLAFSGLQQSNGARLITATTTFRNEPYS